MRIKSVCAALPSKVVTKKMVSELIRKHSQDFQGNLDKVIRLINALLRKSGFNTKRILAEGEKPIDLIKQAAEEAIQKAKIDKSQIDALVYVGIGKGFLEPGNSYFIAKALGLNHAQCFDVLDGCMSWTRGLQILDGMFEKGIYRNALVVNGEFHMTYPFNGEFQKKADCQTFKTNYKLLTEEQISYSFPFFTIGEAATATIVSAEDSNNFKFSFSSKPEFSELCTIPMDNYEGYSEMNGDSGCNGSWSFTSHGVDMHKMGQQEAINVFQQLSQKPEEFDVVLVHSSSKREWEFFAQLVGLKDKVFFTYPETGNVVSASIPTALAMAEKAGKLVQGDRVLCWMGSAGMSFSAYSFIY